MSRPREGEPFFPYPGLRISAGDTEAAPGTDAWKGVIVHDPGGPPTNHIIDTGDAFDLEVQFRTANGGIAFPLPTPTLDVRFHVHGLDGNPAPGSPFPAVGAPATIATPAGDHGTDGAFDVIQWYSSTVTGINLPDGTYRVTVCGHESAAGILFVHDYTLIHVGP
jgi:hypothetical protein